MKKTSTFLKLKEEERAHRKELILEAAMKLFSKHSFYEIGMRDIAEEAGISPASIYRYFSSRDEIVVEILAHEAEEGRQKQLERISSGNLSLKEIAEGIIDFLLQRPSTLQMLGHFLLSEEIDEGAKERFAFIQDYYMKEFNKQLLDFGCLEEDLNYFAKSFFATILGIIVDFRNFSPQDREGTYAHISRLTDLAADIFEKGMSKTRK